MEIGRIYNNVYLKYAIVLLFAITLLIFPSNKPKHRRDLLAPPILAGDTLNCYVMIDKSLSAKGHPLGYIYALFGEFAQQQGCKIDFSHQAEEPLSQWVKLATGLTDMIIINSRKDTVPEMFQDDVISSIPINDNDDVCVIEKNNYKIVQTLNYWLTYFKQTPEYARMSKKYYKKLSHVISPYDTYIKQYAKLLGWDWRLLAALIHQESKFKLGVSSSKGAIGLMQIKESIANTYGITDIYDPESNIKAGVLHLQRLQNMYRKMGADSLDLVEITLAAYNAGEGRIEDCMSVARTLDKDPLKWETIAGVIPLMNEKQYYTKSVVKQGRFRGKETLRFVDEIIAKYNKYLQSVE